jgi:putative ABC transport system permease protein
MNLATAKSSTRAKEVGIRKVMGGSRSNLIGQHLGESVLLVFISTLIAMLLVVIVSPFVNLNLPSSLLNYLFTHPVLLGYIFMVALMVGLMAGVYPAFVLSGFNTAVILRGKFATSNRGISLRKALVVLQFTASIVLIIGTVFVFRQISYIKKKDLGFTKDQVVSLQMSDPGMGEHMIAFRDRLQGYEEIEYASISNNMPGNTFGRTGLTPEGAVNDNKDENETWIVSVMSFDHNYLNMMQMDLSGGRNFNKDSESDQNYSVLVN